MTGRTCDGCGKRNGSGGVSIMSYRVEIDGKVVRRWLCLKCARKR